MRPLTNCELLRQIFLDGFWGSFEHMIFTSIFPHVSHSRHNDLSPSESTYSSIPSTQAQCLPISLNFIAVTVCSTMFTDYANTGCVSIGIFKIALRARCLLNKDRAARALSAAQPSDIRCGAGQLRAADPAPSRERRTSNKQTKRNNKNYCRGR